MISGSNEKELDIANQIADLLLEKEKLQQENKQLKKKYENAVADYELEKYKNNKAIECINYYAIEDDDFNKLYNVEEQELLEILGDKE